MTRQTGPDRSTRDAVRTRSQAICERCGQARATEVHHRSSRRLGGTRKPEVNRLSNLAHLCHQCHRDVTEYPELARGQGWVVPSWAEPAETPVLSRHGLVLLGDDGDVSKTRQGKEAGPLAAYQSNGPASHHETPTA